MASTQGWASFHGQKPYRINMNSFYYLNPPDEGPIDPWEGVTAVVMAADKWNEQATSGHFVNVGDSGLEDLPLYDYDKPGYGVGCKNQGINYSLVVVLNTENNSKARTVPKCFDTQGFATQFLIRIYKTDSLSHLPWNYSVGELENANQWDLVQTLTHEFSHTLGLDHPLFNEFAVAEVTLIGSLRQRDLYKYDLKCTSENIHPGRPDPHRSLTAYRRVSQGGTFGPEQAFTTWNFGHISAGRTKQTGTWEWSNAFEIKNPISGIGVLAWSRGFGAYPTYVLPLEERPGIGPIDAVWRENESYQRVLWASYDETPPYQSTARHYGLIGRSNNDFVNTDWYYLQHCTSMTGWMVCGIGATSLVYSGKAPAVAWDNYNNRTVVAWANQTRAAMNADREIMIAVGSTVLPSPNSTLPQPDNTGIRTSIPPAVACNAWSAGGYYDCVLAYVDQADTYNTVRTRRFWSQTGSYRYYVQMEPSSYSALVRTASPVALWYSDGWWYLAARETGGQQQLKVLRSQDGASWSWYEWTNWGYSAIGPSAVSYWQGTENTLVYAR